LRWILAAAIFAAGASPALAAVTSTLAEDARFLRYEGGTERLAVFFEDGDSSGEVEESVSAGPLDIRCSDTGCFLFGAEPEGFRSSAADGIPLTPRGGQYFFFQTAVTEHCDDQVRSNFSGRLVVTPSTADIVVSWTVDCAEVREEPLPEPPPEPGTGPDPTVPPAIAPGIVLEIAPAGVDSSDAGLVARTAVVARTAGVARELSYRVEQEWTGTFVAGDTCLLDSAGCPLDTPSPDPMTPEPEQSEATTPAPQVTEPTPPEPSETATPVPSESSTPGPSETTSPGAGGPTPPLEPPSWATPTVLSGLSPVSDVSLTLQDVCVAAALAVILVLLAAFPTALLNSAIESATAPRTPRPATGRHLGGWWKAALGVALAAVVSGFVDPHFGLNEMSARAVAAILVALAIDVLIGWSARIWFVRRLRPGEAVTFRFVPLTLLIVVGAVVLTRLTDFHPAIIFGLVAGIVFSSRVSVAQQAHTELIGSGYGFAVAVAAWAVYSLLPDQPGNPALLFAHETLAATAIAGIAALPILLFPARGLPGSSIFQWRRTTWGAVYFVALFAFLVLLMPMPSSWATIGRPLVAWVAIYIAYCLGAVTVWAVVKTVKARQGEGRPAGRRMAT